MATSRLMIVLAKNSVTNLHTAFKHRGEWRVEGKTEKKKKTEIGGKGKGKMGEEKDGERYNGNWERGRRGER